MGEVEAQYGLHFSHADPPEPIRARRAGTPDDWKVTDWKKVTCWKSIDYRAYSSANPVDIIATALDECFGLDSSAES
jgi:hypothetical protein